MRHNLLKFKCTWNQHYTTNNVEFEIVTYVSGHADADTFQLKKSLKKCTF